MLILYFRGTLISVSRKVSRHISRDRGENRVCRELNFAKMTIYYLYYFSFFTEITLINNCKKTNMLSLLGSCIPLKVSLLVLPSHYRVSRASLPPYGRSSYLRGKTLNFASYNLYFNDMIYLQSILTVMKTMLDVQSTCVKVFMIRPVKVETCTGVGLAE